MQDKGRKLKQSAHLLAFCIICSEQFHRVELNSEVSKLVTQEGGGGGGGGKRKRRKRKEEEEEKKKQKEKKNAEPKSSSATSLPWAQAAMASAHSMLPSSAQWERLHLPRRAERMGETSSTSYVCYRREASLVRRSQKWLYPSQAALPRSPGLGGGGPPAQVHTYFPHPCPEGASDVFESHSKGLHRPLFRSLLPEPAFLLRTFAQGSDCSNGRRHWQGCLCSPAHVENGST